MAESEGPPSGSKRFEQGSAFVCVEYPGVVSNPDAMLATLGGLESLSKTYAEPTRRLELCFRPGDPFCHPVCGDRLPATGLLIRIRRCCRRRRARGTTAGSDEDGSSSASAAAPPEEVKYDSEALGIINTTYKFQGMADFQYLATRSGPDGACVSLYDQVLLRNMESPEFFLRDAPLFLPPPIFSRLDNPIDYYYRPEVQHREGYKHPPKLSSENLIGHGRARRPHNAIFMTFEEPCAPAQPLDAAVENWRKLNLQAGERDSETELRKLFQERPVWSKNAIKAKLNLHPEKLKVLLPTVAYYTLTGPWRSLWVLFGFDPRKDASSKVYQMLDFRLRCGIKYGFVNKNLPVKSKRSTFNYSLPNTISKPNPHAANMQQLADSSSAELSSDGRTAAATAKHKLEATAFIFQRGQLPPYRQMFYQLCDLHVDCLQEIVHRNDGKETVCTEKDGWCLPRTCDRLRNIMSNIVRDHIRQRSPGLVLDSPHRRHKKDFAWPDEGEEEEDEEEDEEEEVIGEEEAVSEASENEMETEILDYL
ncbi:general transcription factor 3C polypeptide 5 [Lethenteron reissneri]|uniref:general transcription factor 3C polypeptide 5 n=1 Tax=Lethenteron reissneri TaxID=7753 RepID=UPI002AB72902|nr:general transcription factor 3C polypeptide 5 [Lethenteron reissneri]